LHGGGQGFESPRLHSRKVMICREIYRVRRDHGCTYQIAAEVIRYHKLPAPVWIEHYPKETTNGTSETFELVVFSSYEIRERAPYLGETRLTVGDPTWKVLDRETVEALIGQEV
jgi:hypothetical protein